MVRPEVVDYLRENLPSHSVTELRLQLEDEGVALADFEDSLTEARLPSKPKPPPPPPKPAPAPKKAKPRGNAAALLLAGGLCLLIGVGVFALTRRLTPVPAAPGPKSPAESGYVDPKGWVVRLPENYVGVPKIEDPSKADEVVYFCPKGMDPTNFIDRGLYGELGIVRLEVGPSDFPPNMTGAADLAAAASRKITKRGEKFIMKNIRIGTLPGVQIDVQAPFPRVESYVLGRNSVYFFYGGQDGNLWRSIVFSLRDAQTED